MRNERSEDTQREREREKKRKRERERERVPICVNSTSPTIDKNRKCFLIITTHSHKYNK